VCNVYKSLRERERERETMLLLLLLMACSGNDSRATERSSHSIATHTSWMTRVKRERENMKEETNLLMVSMTDSPLYCLIHSSSASKSTHTHTYLWEIEKKRRNNRPRPFSFFLTFLNSNFKYLAPYGFVLCVFIFSGMDRLTGG
jgi:hypothetical protein